MTLSEFLTALNNPNMLITVQDSDNSELIKLYAAGHAQLLATLLAREIDKVTIVNPQNATVLLKAA